MWQARITTANFPPVNGSMWIDVQNSFAEPLPKWSQMSKSPHVEPITFQALYMERVWGGRELQHLYERALPEQSGPIGEAWEMVDRLEHQSVVNHGPLEGTTLHDLWTRQRDEIFGNVPDSERFPLLLKILDAREDLSIQVHPPAAVAEQLHGEPKNEMWYIANNLPGAKLHIGLRKGTSRENFSQAIEAGDVARHIHTVEAKSGQSILIPSGRLHAIGGGFVIHEIQQNSDTTYRVYDWNRLGLDGRPRTLHIDQSLKCIDFDDIEPALSEDTCDHRCVQFHTRQHELGAGEVIGNPMTDRFSIVTLIEGILQSSEGRTFTAGDSILLPKGDQSLSATTPVKLLQTIIPDASS